ncbi:hypothetical protein A4A49_35793 [Nicotiana attenuata]|uniref:DUF4283 domain-containing protein n=1 Tax=Nicotiana attenuata TaxID=49451 RepID=A0A1J6JU95_NICAT|nr:hypothetical protein A4A49_35793 [Nicotiana attenuata]
MAKVRIEIDLLKQQHDAVYVGQVYEDAPQKGFVQKLEYAGVLKYCKHCRKIGHDMMNCRILERKRELEKKEQEAKHDKEGSVESEKNEEKTVIKEAEAGEVRRPNVEQNSQKKQGQGIKQDNKTLCSKMISIEDQPSNENRVEGQEKRQSIKGRTTKKTRVRKEKKIPKKKSKVTFKHVKYFGSSKNKAITEADMKNLKEDNLQMNILMETNRSEHRIQNGDEGSTNVTKNQSQNDNEEAAQESSNIEAIKTDKAPDWQRGVNTKKAMPRLKKLVNINKVEFIALMEPFASMNKIDKYMRFLMFKHCISNTNGQNWLMWSGNFQTSVVSVNDQQITIIMQNGVNATSMFITIVYAKCNANERKDLWCSLKDTHMLIDGPWCIGGDFNAILDPDEKQGGRPHRMYKSLDFSSCMNNYEFKDLGYVGPKFTWCNNWGLEEELGRG